MAEILGAVGGSLINSGLEYLGNRKAQESAQDENRWMFKHRYQLTMQDMQRAGLNPILAHSQGPGSPSSSPSASSHGPDIVGAMSSAKQMQRVNSEIELQEAQRKNVDVDSAKKLQETLESAYRSTKTQAEVDKLFEETKRVRHETTSASAKAYQDKADEERRRTIGPKSHLTDLAETIARTLKGTAKSLGLLNETPKRQAEREKKPAVPANKAGRSGQGRR